MVKYMKEEIINMLIYDNDSELSTRYNFPLFVAKMLSFSYKKLNSGYHRNMMVNKIESGYYSSQNEINNMAYHYISNAVLYSPDHGKEMLINMCNLSEEEADSFIAKLTHYNSNIRDLLSAELDVSNTNRKMKELVDSVINAFLENERNSNQHQL